MIDELLELYKKPKRFYHTFAHIEALLILYHELESQWNNPAEVYLSFLYHDAIYEYGAKDNEERSALVAEQQIRLHIPNIQIDIDRVKSLIRYTANHGSLLAEELNEEEKLFLDCDMSILGSEPETFLQYEEQIEREYTQVYPRFLYRVGRKKFRSTLKKTKRIFFSDLFHNRLDRQARKNLS
jgi:predicted metal-dependent HD superfamily phosphohydrolase